MIFGPHSGIPFGGANRVTSFVRINIGSVTVQKKCYSYVHESD